MSIDTDNRVIKRTVHALRAGVPYILHQGGTSSGKTFGILYSLLFFALKYLPPKSTITIVSQTLPHLKKGAINDFRKIIGMTEISSQIMENKSDHVFHLPNGTKFEFYAPDDEEKAKSGKRDLLFINEANSVSYAIAQQLMMRTNGPVILDWNPSGKFWLHRMLLPALQSGDYLFTRTTYRDNKAVSEKIIQEIERLKIIDPSEYDVYGLGIEGKGTEIIFPNYELVDPEDFPDTPLCGRGLDFGFTNDPSAGLRCALNDGALWFDELFYEKGLSNRLIFERFEMFPYAKGPCVADSAEPKSIAELYGMGMDIIGAVKGPDSVKYGIDKIKEYPIKITRTSTNLLDEIDSFKWVMKDGVPTNKPRPGHDHHMSAMRYAVQAVLFAPEPITVRVQRSTEMGFSSYGI